MVSITIDNLTKRFGATTAVDRVGLSIPAGTLFFLLGPSGCGKTTLLRMIAGFTMPTEGRLLFDDHDITTVPPHQRDTGMVFQSYALWPHMSVANNVGFGLDARKMPRAERAARITEALTLVQMAHLANRKPNQLSGGQQQRVALARALAIRPKCLLLDEPLSNLDAKLRSEMRGEIRRIVKAAGTTAIYVTHDQKEALAMADAIAVMRSGKVEQVGTPIELYHHPASRFVADFIGESNFLDGAVTSAGASEVMVQTAIGPLHAIANARTWHAGQRVVLAFRPEAVHLSDERCGEPNCLTARRVATTYLGETAEHVVELANGQRIKAFELNPRMDQSAGESCMVSFAPESLMLVDKT